MQPLCSPLARAVMSVAAGDGATAVFSCLRRPQRTVASPQQHALLFRIRESAAPLR
jgi:hypothetical protein